MLDERVMHLMSTRITGNDVLGCSNMAVSALGLGAPGSSMTIARNGFNITGSGIRCGVDGIWIEGNKLVNSTTRRAARADSSIGIALARGVGQEGLAQCQILANQVSGFAGAGIEIGSSPRELIVKLNIIENCGNGVVSTARANAGSISIENNLLRDIGLTDERAGAMVVGIGLTRADHATIAGNTIRTLGVQASRSTLRAGIVTFGVLRPRVSGNEVTDLAPAVDFLGTAAGIMLRAPYTQFEVSHNNVQRDATPSGQASNSAWLALVAADIDPEKPVLRMGDLAAIRVDRARILVLNAGRAYVWTLADASEPVRGSVLGNILTARGIGPAVELSAAGECLLNDNRIESLANTGRPAVMLATVVAIVNANRVRGGEVSIDLVGTKSAAVLGNITTAAIRIPGGLNAPWDALNLRA